MTAAGNLCSCGCAASLAGMREGTKYATAACRTRAYRLRRQRAAKPSQNRHRAPDLRVGYHKVVDAVALDLAGLTGFDPPLARQRAAATLAPLLSDRQRAHLERVA